MHNAAYAQNSNTGFGETTHLAVPNTGNLLGVVLDKSRATLRVILSSTSSSDNGTLTIQIPIDVVDNKKEGNADALFRVQTV